MPVSHILEQIASKTLHAYTTLPRATCHKTILYKMKQFADQGVEKNNADAKRIFFQKSDKLDEARDVLLLELRQLAL